MKKIDLSNKTILVTGVAGFIGANLCMRLVSDFQRSHIIGIDSMNDYYDSGIKRYRLEQIRIANGVRHQAGSAFSFLPFRKSVPTAP